MNNHYVSQFVIKNFSKVINVYDLKQKQLLEKQKASNVFCDIDRYPSDIEKGMQRFETRVSQILYNKLSHPEKITITRRNLADLKIYCMICSVRTLEPLEFYQFLSKINSTKFIKEMYKDICKNLKSFKDLKLSAEELYYRALKIFTDIRNIQDIPNHNLCTIEIFYWSLPFLCSYMAIWDSAPSMEFVLSDNGMMSEYEGVFLLTGGISVSKLGYLYEKMQDNKNSDLYSNLFIQNVAMYENYNFFNIGSNRIVVLMNPFFWLFNKSDIEKPNIWPCIIQNQKLFTTPSHKYMNHFFYMDDDTFTYIPKILDEVETIYINSIICSQSRNFIGYNDPKKVVDSFSYFSWELIHYKSLRKNLTKNELITNLINNFVNDPYKNLLKNFESKNIKTKVKLENFFNLMYQWKMHDFWTNEYIPKYLLREKDKVINNKNFDFLGKGKLKIKALEDHLLKILKRKN